MHNGSYMEKEEVKGDGILLDRLLMNLPRKLFNYRTVPYFINNNNDLEIEVVPP